MQHGAEGMRPLPLGPAQAHNISDLLHLYNVTQSTSPNILTFYSDNNSLKLALLPLLYR